MLNKTHHVFLLILQRFPGRMCQEETFQFYLCVLLKGLCITDSQTVVSSAETHSAWKYERLHITESWREKRRHKNVLSDLKILLCLCPTCFMLHLGGGGAVEMFKRLPHPVWHVHVLTLPCPLSQYILKDTYSVTARCKALGILNCRQRVFVGFCFQFHAGLHFSFEGGFYSSNSHLASHVLALFLWECNPPVANEHLFAWIRYERGVTVSIAERIISHSTHSKRQPEDGSGPRAHRRALRDPAANLPSLR